MPCGLHHSSDPDVNVVRMALVDRDRRALGLMPPFELPRLVMHLSRAAALFVLSLMCLEKERRPVVLTCLKHDQPKSLPHHDRVLPPSSLPCGLL